MPCVIKISYLGRSQTQRGIAQVQIQRGGEKYMPCVIKISYTLNGLKLNFLDRITGLAGLDLYPVYPVILSK